MVLEHLKTYRNKKCLPIFSLANRFARTPPSSLPGFEEIDTSYILPITPLVKFWIAAVEVFGAVYLPANTTKTIYSKTNKPTPITPLRKIYMKHNRDNLATQPVTSEGDLHSDNGTGLQNILSEQPSKAILKANITWRATYTNLARLTEKSTAVLHLLNTGIRLAKPQPIQIPGWVDEDLVSSLIADTWVGAQETFGALRAKPPPGVTFSPQVEEPAQGTNNPPKASPRPSLYITHIKKAPKAKKTPKKSYTTVTFLLSLSPLQCKESKDSLMPKQNCSWRSMKSGKLFFPSNRTRPTFFRGSNQTKEWDEGFRLFDKVIPSLPPVTAWRLATSPNGSWPGLPTLPSFASALDMTNQSMSTLTIKDKPVNVYLDHQRVFNRLDDLEATFTKDKLQTA
jgi:hypothetical protein